MHNIDLIIPVFNESPRISIVLDVLSKSKYLDTIICLDDASTDNSAKVIEEGFPNVKLIRFQKNFGKSRAILEGCRFSKAENIFVCDGDLSNLKIEEIDFGIEKFMEENLDLLIFRRKDAPITVKILRADVLMSGERIMRREDLISILEKVADNYLIEISTNYYFRDGKTAFVNSSGINFFKQQKYGFFLGWWKDTKMYIEIFIKHNALVRYNYINQIIFFCKKELK